MSGPGQRVLALLRQMIAEGSLTAGERIAEIPTAERLGVSRMPVRMAFRVLEQEGLLIRHGARGYAVRQLGEEELAGAVEVRGVLEGLAARAQGDQLFDKGYLSEEDLTRYHDINLRFHQTLVEASGNPAIATALARNDHLPFASVSALAVDRAHLDREYRRFNFAHLQHHAAVDAVLAGQGARAEGIMREHANATLRYARLFGTEEGGSSGRTVIQRGGRSQGE
ncbi:MAG: GntR family transcriptional regulator [Gammaproteobacteria bacterium HGW-Gammaproteobacteria-12]|nr:MAG: GntR family transcriptional regulator [Gammaproteobacteria bacterium HGW-Gammaproteobacteria-12]